MMKKNRLMLVTLAAALCLFSWSSALAEMEVYVNPSNGYQISYPSDWTILNRETIDMLLGLAVDGNIPGIDGAVLGQYAAQIEQLDVVMFITPSGDTPTIGYEDAGIPLSPNLIQTLVCPQMIAQYEAMFDQVEVLDPGSIVTIGDNEFVFMSIKATIMGTQMQIDIYSYSHGNLLYSLGFTADDPTTQDILASFAPGA